MQMDHSKLSSLLETAIVAARAAGQLAIEELEYVKVSIKNGNEVVTQADVKCQNTIIAKIKQNFPDHGFIGEEGEDGKSLIVPPRGDDNIWWVIDPIDGTNNFAHKLLTFTVSIAAVCDGEPIVGVIFEPTTDSIYTAVKDGQAQLNERTIEAGNEKIDMFASIGLDSNFDNGVPQWTQYIMQHTRYRNFGTTALHLACVAKGGLIACIVQGAKLWDIAAGVLIAEAAGGLVTDWQGKRLFPIDLDNYQHRTFNTLAANKTVQPELIELLGKG
ncbi:MAG: inositol monophosphatase [Phycisphaerae bacterium]|nr:inositol monophosphatase [Phycisphaerae bacterium]